jgi:hypothetical protein
LDSIVFLNFGDVDAHTFEMTKEKEPVSDPENGILLGDLARRFEKPC